MRAISLKLPEDLDERLTQLAARKNVSRSALIRAALDAYVGEQPISVTGLAGDLVGSLDGPEDLSSSPHHLLDYAIDRDFRVYRR